MYKKGNFILSDCGKFYTDINGQHVWTLEQDMQDFREWLKAVLDEENCYINIGGTNMPIKDLVEELIGDFITERDYHSRPTVSMFKDEVDRWEVANHVYGFILNENSHNSKIVRELQKAASVLRKLL